MYIFNISSQKIIEIVLNFYFTKKENIVKYKNGEQFQMIKYIICLY